MKSKLLVPILAAAFVLAACGGGDDAPPLATPVSADAVNPQVAQRVTTADDQFCASHAGLFSQRSLENLEAVADPHIIQTTFQEEVICNDRFGAIRTFVILTGELVS